MYLIVCLYVFLIACLDDFFLLQTNRVLRNKADIKLVVADSTDSPILVTKLYDVGIT